MVKEDISIKQKGIYYPPRITAFDIETIDILAGSGGKKEDGETPVPDINTGEFGEDFFNTKSFSYDPAWGDDEE